LINTIQNNPFINFRGPNKKPVADACKVLYGRIGKETSPRVPVAVNLEGAGDVFLSCTKPSVALSKRKVPHVIKISVHGAVGEGAFAFFDTKGTISTIKKALKNQGTPEKIEKIIEKLTEGIKNAGSSEAKDII
jgi:hypothetical protein